MEFEMDKEAIKNIETKKRDKPVGIHIHLDKETFDLYKSQGKGHVTLMQDILTEYAKVKFNT